MNLETGWVYQLNRETIFERSYFKSFLKSFLAEMTVQAYLVSFFYMGNLYLIASYFLGYSSATQRLESH